MCVFVRHLFFIVQSKKIQTNILNLFNKEILFAIVVNYLVVELNMEEYGVGDILHFIHEQCVTLDSTVHTSKYSCTKYISNVVY